MKHTAKPRIVHCQSLNNPDKGRCGKRGHQSKMLAVVTCVDCRPALMPRDQTTAVAAMHKMAGVR